MPAAHKRLERMRVNPRDWKIEDVVSVAKEWNLEVRSHGGSHYTFSHPDVDLHVTIPAHRPIKPVYIKEFIKFVDIVRGNT
jgi:predicted RNA binding protein YcfA (HicA-like mRNA interferase family)